jgi:hypothetical protein
MASQNGRYVVERENKLNPPGRNCVILNHQSNCVIVKKAHLTFLEWIL